MTGAPNAGQMGSGELGTAGLLQAVYQRGVSYVPLLGTPTTAVLTAYDTPGFYTTLLVNGSGDPNWGTYFFFGGPKHP